jgi:ribonuclease Y
MEIAITAAAAAAVAAAVAWIVRGRSREDRSSGSTADPSHGSTVLRRTEPSADELRAHTEQIKPPPPDGARDLAQLREQVELELRERRAEIVRLEERILQREESLEARLADLGRREQSLVDRERNAERLREELREARHQQLREIERLAGLSQAQAKQILLRETEEEARYDAAKLVRQIEEETRRDADRRVRSILSVCMQRLAAGHAAETTVSVVNLPSDDMKGRIIGREGRNIRVLENLTGVDFIIDDTPSAVVLSAFDGVRREIAKLTLERLLLDGRIHPARIEEAYYQAKSEIDNHIVEQGEQAMFEANVHSLHAELVKLLGRLKYRTSYGQNVLAHSIEVSRLAAMMADELGASAKTARRAALLHDIGKAVSHEIEGPHALVGGELARRYKESEAVAHAMEAHHNEVEMQTIEAVIVQAADSLSGARPGARGESLEQYVKRLKDLEEIAERRDGVEKVYAMQAGREIRVMVAPGEVGDDQAALLSREIARDIEKEVEYPGQIKVTVIRESRSVEYAK